MVGVALLLPARTLDPVSDPTHPPARAKESREVERRAVDAVLAAERSPGRVPEEKAHNHKGYDIASQQPDGHVVFLEVKGRLAGAEDFVASYNEIMHAKNSAPRCRLAMVRARRLGWRWSEPDGSAHDLLRYVWPVRPHRAGRLQRHGYHWQLAC